MAVEKEKLLGLLDFFGFNVNADAVTKKDEEDMEPGAMDESTEDEEEPMLKRPVKKNRADEPAPRSVRQEPAGDFTNLLQLNQLIDDVGGMEAFRGLLLNAVDAVEFMQHNQADERSMLASVIVANSGGALVEDDLESVPVPTLQKMAQAYAPIPVGGIDFRMLGARGVKQNKAEDIAAPPSFFLATNEKKED